MERYATVGKRTLLRTPFQSSASLIACASFVVCCKPMNLGMRSKDTIENTVLRDVNFRNA